MKNQFFRCIVAFLVIITSCEDTENLQPDPDTTIYYLPLVVHVIHNGEPMGEGTNLSTERILRQIEILNEDFRRKKGTRGFNDHPDGGDTRIEFVLAKQDPDGKPTDGIVRIDTSLYEAEDLGYGPNNFAQYSYWPPDECINIWTTPLQASVTCIGLGLATGPDTDLPGTSYLALPQPGDAEGILINWAHFGESDIDCQARFGRTLTHEMGHHLGLLHTWGTNECDENDFCHDTPAVNKPVTGRTPYTGCAGEMVMIGNYMNYSDDDVMNIFTNDQIARMHYVLQHHPGRKALLSSHMLKEP